MFIGFERMRTEFDESPPGRFGRHSESHDSRVRPEGVRIWNVLQIRINPLVPTIFPALLISPGCGFKNFAQPIARSHPSGWQALCRCCLIAKDRYTFDNARLSRSRHPCASAFGGPVVPVAYGLGAQAFPGVHAFALQELEEVSALGQTESQGAPGQVVPGPQIYFCVARESKSPLYRRGQALQAQGSQKPKQCAQTQDHSFLLQT